MSATPLDLERFRRGSREFGILPFWFLNGELDPDEMRFQLRELREKGMHGVVLHGRYGLEMPYLSERYLERIRLAAEEANRLGLATWIYDEMNWPSGTADKRVLRERPDLSQRYVECLGFTIRGPWFMCLTGEDSRYLDFERSDPVAAFAMDQDGRTIDLTPNLSFERVVPWEVPPGEWRLMYIVEKRADYYIDALDPESTATFLRVGYQPYLDAVSPDGKGTRLVGFYSDEPAMHYFVTGGDNPVVPWTKDMLKRFSERNGYDLRPRLPDLFFDLSEDSARIRHDFYTTLTEFYTNAYYRQIHEWCRARGLTFTAHLLYEEWLRSMIRVEGNLFRHYANMDVVAVDHLYPVIGTRESPDQHVAIKVASSAAHQFGSPRLICESFGGIFMDATMQRMKWIADWEYVLGVTLLNPHGFHYTLEGARKRDWPPSMFYQYPWWRYYEGFSHYISRLSEMLSGGRHVARVAVLWPINAMMATYRPDVRTPLGTRIESDFNVLTDLLLRLHVDFDYLDEDVLAAAEISDGAAAVGDERYECVIVPPMGHVRLATVDRLEELVRSGGGVLGIGVLPSRAFGPDGLVDVEDRLQELVVPRGEAARGHASEEQPGGGRSAFLPSDGLGQDALPTLRTALEGLVEFDIEIDNPELFSLHREREGRDVYFVVNPTPTEQTATVTLRGTAAPRLWDPTGGTERPVASASVAGGRASFELWLPPVGSVFVVGSDDPAAVEEREPPASDRASLPEPLVLDGDWEFRSDDPNALVLSTWRASPEREGSPPGAFAAVNLDDGDWLAVVPGAWALQLPAEPEGYPVPVWFRAAFDADHVPGRAQLVVDGWSGSDPRLFVNGEEIRAHPARSPFDSEMKVIDVTGSVRRGRNVVAIRLTINGPTGGVLDRLKILGDFALERREDGGYCIVSPPSTVRAGPWTEQGYPFLSGVGRYRRVVDVPERFDGVPATVAVPMADDVLEVVLNGESVGVCLWDPYEVELTGRLRPGPNELELRVANTAANLIGGTERPSGVSGPPTIVARRPREPGRGTT